MDEDTKKIITGLLSSTPLQLTVSRLARDFKDTVGYDIPFRELGYHSAEHYLRSIPDTVLVHGHGGGAYVLLVIKEKSAHINEMINKQKKPKARAPLRMTVKPIAPQNAYFQPSPGVYNQMHSQPVHRRSNYYSTPISIKPPSTNNIPPPTYTKPSLTYNVPRPTNNIPPIKNISPPTNNIPPPTNYVPPIKNIPPPTNNTPIKNISPPTNYVPPNKNIPPLTNTKPPAANNIRVELPQKTSEPQEIPRRLVTKENTVKNIQPRCSTTNEPSDYPSYVKNALCEAKVKANAQKILNLFYEDELYVSEDEEDTRVPKEVVNNLRGLIGDHPEGIWCCDLPKFYTKRYNCELDYTAYNFRTLNEMCLYLKRTFHYVRPGKGDFKLYDSRKPIPEDLSLHLDDESVESVEILPKESIFNGHSLAIPEDAVQYLEEVPRERLPENKTINDYVDLNVGEIYDLSKFWFILNIHELNDLMDEMQIFYEENAHDLKVPQTMLKEGLYCVSLFMNEYHRAMIVTTSMQNNKLLVKVFYIDYGTVAVADEKTICYLHKKFAALPAQAIRGRLFGVLPPRENSQWSREASAIFLKMVQAKQLVGKIEKIDQKKEIIHLTLIEPKGDKNQDVYINTELVKQGYAVTKQKDQKPVVLSKNAVPLVNFLHLYPTFLEIEQGIVPCTTEMIEFEKKNIPLELIYPHYFQKYYYVEKQTPTDSQESDAADQQNEDSMQIDKRNSSSNSSQKSESGASKQKVSFIVRNRCDPQNEQNCNPANEVPETAKCDTTTNKKEFSPVTSPNNSVTSTEFSQSPNIQPQKPVRPPPGFSCKPAAHGFAPNAYMPNTPIFMPNPQAANRGYVAIPTYAPYPNYSGHNYTNFVPNTPYQSQYNYITNVYPYGQCMPWGSQNARMQDMIMQNQNVYGRVGNLNPFAPSFSLPIPGMVAANNNPVQNIPNASPVQYLPISNTVQYVQNMASKEKTARDEGEVLSRYLSNLTSTCSVKETESSKTSDTETEKRSHKTEGQTLSLLDVSLDELERTLGNKEQKISHLNTKESSKLAVTDIEKDGKFVRVSDFCNKPLHIVTYDNTVYAMVDEVLKLYANRSLSIVAVRKHLMHIDLDIPLKDISLEKVNDQMKEELKRYKLLKDDIKRNSLLHLIPLNSIQDLINVFKE